MTDNKQSSSGQKQEPTRRCIVTGEIRAKEEMIRFVVGPEDKIVPDFQESLPGRGLWLTARRDIVDTACSKGAFARAARRKVSLCEGLSDRLEKMLLTRCQNFLGLAIKAGIAVAGFEKVRAALGKVGQGKKVPLLLAAVDGGEDGRRRISALDKGGQEDVLEVFSGAELGETFGRERIVHVFVGPGGLADRLKKEAGRLSGFRQGTL